MCPYTITIKHEYKSDRTIFIENENGIRIYGYDKEEDIEIQDAFNNAIYLTKENFLELYELMTALKKYIDEK